MIKRFNLKDEAVTVDAMLQVKDPEIVYEIIWGIFYGIARGSEEIDLFEVEDAGNTHTFSIGKHQWSKALNKCMEVMIELEDYETCSEINKAKAILSNI